MKTKSVKLIIASRGGQAQFTLCLDHAVAAILSAGGGSNVEVGRGTSDPCDLCRTAEGVFSAMLASRSPDQLHAVHEALGCDATDSDEDALREVAIVALTRLGLLQLCSPHR